MLLKAIEVVNLSADVFDPLVGYHEMDQVTDLVLIRVAKDYISILKKKLHNNILFSKIKIING